MMQSISNRRGRFLYVLRNYTRGFQIEGRRKRRKITFENLSNGDDINRL